MDFNEYLDLSNATQRLIYANYKSKTPNYKLSNNFEDYLDDLQYCDQCNEWLEDTEFEINSYEEFGIESLCEYCYDTYKEDMR